MHDIWVHSLSAAVASDLVAKARKRPLPMAFVGGLVHDIGKPVALSTFLSLQRKDPSLFVDRETLLGMVERVHAQLGGLIASRWNLPDDLKSAIANHHRANVVKGPHAELVRVVAGGDAICRALYIGYPRPENARDADPAGIVELHSLGIEPADAEGLCTAVLHKSESIRNI